MTAEELRKKYLNFFQDKGHVVIPSASLIPENDPTVLFTTAGMHPLVPYLLGEKHPGGQRLVSSQKCLRTGDIDEVGDLTHLTFFEMLGNWSLGDYFKQEAINWSYEFLTSEKYLGLNKNKLAFSVFMGDSGPVKPDDHGASVPFDQESYDAWVGLGVAPERIAKLDKNDNWWGPAGQTGPCGPDTEMFYWTGEGEGPANFQDTHEDKNWVEIWNDVFMAYNKNADGSFSDLKQKNVDTGMGLERVLGVINNIKDVYQTDLFLSIINELEKLSDKSYADNPRPFRIVADHLRAATFIIGDDQGVVPSNTDQGYIVRRLLRRALRYAWLSLGITKRFLAELAEKTLIPIMKDSYPELSRNTQKIYEAIDTEEEKFSNLLFKGEKLFEKKTKDQKSEINGQEAFNFFQTYGYPIEMTKEISKEKGLKLSNNFDQEFNQELSKHQALSRTASSGKFKGGLADDSLATSRLHTATHLLLAALKKVLGAEVNQRGSNITAERLRLDFSYNSKPTPEQLKEVERLVNQAITNALPVTCQEMSLEEAKAQKATGIFESKYGNKVKVYTAGALNNPFSREICGGPHATNTAELKSFKILKEEASSAGVRRIKAVVGS